MELISSMFVPVPMPPVPAVSVIFFPVTYGVVPSTPFLSKMPTTAEAVTSPAVEVSEPMRKSPDVSLMLIAPFVSALAPPIPASVKLVAAVIFTTVAATVESAAASVMLPLLVAPKLYVAANAVAAAAVGTIPPPTVVATAASGRKWDVKLCAAPPARLTDSAPAVQGVVASFCAASSFTSTVPSAVMESSVNVAFPAVASLKSRSRPVTSRYTSPADFSTAPGVRFVVRTSSRFSRFVAEPMFSASELKVAVRTIPVVLSTLPPTALIVVAPTGLLMSPDSVTLPVAPSFRIEIPMLPSAWSMLKVSDGFARSIFTVAVASGFATSMLPTSKFFVERLMMLTDSNESNTCTVPAEPETAAAAAV